MKPSLRIITISALATATLIKGVPALAEPVEKNVSVVATADLDLGKAADRTKLERRLVNAVAEVCGDASASDLAGQNAVRACRATTLAQARRDSAALAEARVKSPAMLVAAR